ncbi:MAG: hypothetical protein GY739_14465 [Mesoflavibacter sp.]|nr:hypothetical protein [Mesoflavibacter sp.]
MYLAPLNYDRFFKKVFKDLKISQKFLEDLLNIKIQEIEKLDPVSRMTDESSVVEFDFRCKIDNAYVIIDMQQWYKQDVAHRFFVYHAASTVLQLEKLPLKSIVIDSAKKEEKKIKDYRLIAPVLTVIWMVDDCLGHEGDILAYRMLPESVGYFLDNSELWEKKDFKALLKRRNELLDELVNDTKSLDFIPKNRLLFAFQKNIIKNKKINQYIRWFELAEKTRNRENIAKDFDCFEKDQDFEPVYKRIKQRLVKDNLKVEELQYINDESTRQERIQRTLDGYMEDKESEIRNVKRKLGRKLKEKDQVIEENKQVIEEKDQVIEENKQVIEENKQVIEENKQMLEEKDQVIKNAFEALIKKGLSKKDAKKILGL